MSDKPSHGATHDDHAHHGATTVRASKGGGAGKWLMSGVAAVVLLGGGYLAYQNYAPSQSQSEIAYNDTYADDNAMRAGPLPADENLTADAASDESVAPPAAEPRAASGRRSTARTQAAAVPEETIGIAPVTLASVANDDIVVRGAQRPVWASTPSARRLSTYYPQSALDRGREGEASLQCMVGDRGRLDCTPVSETPARAGFGRAAVRVAHTFRHAEQRADGSSAVGTPVNLRVVFRMPEDERRG